MKGHQVDSEMSEMIKYLAIQESLNKSRFSCDFGRCFGIIVHPISKNSSTKKLWASSQKIRKFPDGGVSHG